MTKDRLSKSDIKKVCDILRRDDGVGANDYVEQLSWLLFLKVFEKVEEQLKEFSDAEGKKYKNILDQEYLWSAWARKDWKDKDELTYFVNQKLFPYLKNLKGTPEKEKVSEIFRELSGNKIRSANNMLDVIDILDQIEMEHFQDTHLLSQVYEEILQEMGSEGGWAGEFYTPRPVIRLMVKVVKPQIGESIFDPYVGSSGFLIEAFDFLKEKNKIGLREWNTLQKKTFFGQEKKPLPFLIGTMNMILHGILVPSLKRTNSFMEDVHNLPESSKVDVILTNPPFGGEEEAAIQNNYPLQVAATEGLALQYVVRKLKNGGRGAIVLPEGQVLFGGGTFKKIREEFLSKCEVSHVVSLPKGVFTAMGAGVKTNLIFFSKTGPTKNIWYGEVEGNFTRVQIIKDSDLEDIYKKLVKLELSDNSWMIDRKYLEENDFSLEPKNPNKLNSQKTHRLGKDILSEIGSQLQKSMDILSEIEKIDVK